MGKLGAVLAALGVGAAVCLLGAGCTTPGPACAGGSIPVPSVYLDASPWLADHPGEKLDACYGTRCTPVTAHDRTPVQLIHAGTGTNERESAPLTLTVTTDAGPGTPLASAKVALLSSSFDSPCGRITSWGRNVELTTAGTLEVHGWNGRIAPPASPIPDPTAAESHAEASEEFENQLQQLEKKYGVRIGVDAQIVGTEESVSYRGDERFAFDSTGKLFSAGLLLRRDSDAQLGTIVRYSSTDLVAHSPITSQHVADGMTVRDLIAAALQYSDNTAENLMLAQLGGPAAVEQQLGGLGDTVTHVDRTEPALNSAVPDDPQDTTTPAQFADDLRRFVLGGLLTPERSEWLLTTMRANTTGAAGIRAAVEPDWTVADKTGSGAYGTSNDVAVIAGPAAGPIVLTIFTTGTTPDATAPAGLIPDITTAAIAGLG